MAASGRGPNRSGKEQPAPRTFTVRSGTTGGRLRLSALDMITGALYVDRGFYFRETLDGAALRESLAAAMRRYQPLSGRLEQDADGGFSVVCNDTGAVFEEVDSDLDMAAHEPGRPGRPSLKQLMPKMPLLQMTGENVPMLAVRLTHTAGGGSILAVRIKHALVDARAHTTFLTHWSREHRGLSYPEPNHDRELLDESGAQAPLAASEHSDRFCVPSQARRGVLLARIGIVARRLTTLHSRFSAAEARALKAAAMSDLEGTDRWISTSDALTAHLWRTLGELRDRPSEANETLGLLARFTSTAPGITLPEHYWGNTITTKEPGMTAGDLRSRPLGEVAYTVRESLATISEEQVQAESAYLLAQRAAGRAQRVTPRMVFGAFSEVVQINNLSKLPTYEPEFGGGTPFWYELPNKGIGWMVDITSTPEADGSVNVQFTLPRSVAARFQEDSWQRRLHAYAPEADDAVTGG